MSTKKDLPGNVGKTLKIAMIGYGKMGKAIEEMAIGRGHTTELKIDIDNITQFTSENLRRCDVAIEFTGPHSAKENILKCIDAGIPVVSGSTGWLANWNNVENYCKEKNGSLLYASNFSVGVNIFFELNKKLAQLMKNYEDYNVSMEEIHHTQKKMHPAAPPLHWPNRSLKKFPVKPVG